MKKLTLLTSALIFTTACTTTTSTGRIDEAQAVYDRALTLRGIQNAAASNMGAAKESLNRAKQSAEDGAKQGVVNHHAWVAIQQSEIAKEKLSIKNSQQRIEDANLHRQKLLLDARTKEAQEAESRADAATKKLRAAQAEAADLAGQLENLKSEQSDRGLVLTLDDINFDLNSDELREGGTRTIERIAAFLSHHEKRQVLIEGHTDSSGSDAYNQNLSERRANAVSSALANYGIAASRLSTKGLGETYPVTSNETLAGRQKNRRVELIVANTDDTAVESRQ